MKVRQPLFLLIALAYSTTNSYATACQPFECQEDGIFADPCDCSKYYLCNNGNANKETCPSGTLWNQELEGCDLEENVQCLVNRLAAKPSPLLKADTRSGIVAPEKSSRKESKYVSVCYFSNWSYYYKGKYKFDFKNLDEVIKAKLCTHLVYAFANLSRTAFTIESSDPYVDLPPPVGQDYYKKFTDLSKGVVKLLSIGGAKNSEYADYSALVASKKKRKTFIDDVVKFLKEHKFDGLDFDWEFPGKDDKDNFSKFLKELKQAFDKKNLTLTAAVKATGLDMYDVPELSEHLDYIHLMTYDFYDGVYKKADHHAKLYPDVNSAISQWEEKKASKDKLVLGIPAFGRSFTLEDSSQTTPQSPAAGPGNMDTMTEEEGYLGYYEICKNFFNEAGGTIITDSAGKMGPYAYKNKQWVGYDDEDMAKKKAEYVKENNLKGTMIWALDIADAYGTCTSGGQKYPLLQAIKKVLRP